MAEQTSGDFFDVARRASAIVIALAAGLAVVGSTLDWVHVEPPPRLPPSQAARAQPFSGLDAGDGWWTLGGGVVLGACAVAIDRRRRGARLAFLVAIAIGAIVFADYRDIGDPTSPLARRTDVVGSTTPALGIALCAAAAIAALLGSVAAIAATPRDRSSGR